MVDDKVGFNIELFIDDEANSSADGDHLIKCDNCAVVPLAKTRHSNFLNLMDFTESEVFGNKFSSFKRNVETPKQVWTIVLHFAPLSLSREVKDVQEIQTDQKHSL